MALAKSDKVGIVAAVVGMIVMLIFVLWPRKKTAATPPPPSDKMGAASIPNPAPGADGAPVPGALAANGGGVQQAAGLVANPAPMGTPAQPPKAAAAVLSLHRPIVII